MYKELEETNKRLHKRLWDLERINLEYFCKVDLAQMHSESLKIVLEHEKAMEVALSKIKYV